MRRTAVAVAGAACAALILAGCSAGGSSGESDGVINFALSADPGTIDPVLNATAAGQEVTAFGYQSLLTYPTGDEAVGVLAEDWEGTTTEVTFTMRQGVHCADGTEIMPTDVAATFEYANASGSPFTGIYFHPEVEISADDEARTVTFTNPVPNAFLAQSLGAMPIICPAGLEDPSQLESEQFGTGAYDLADSSPGQSYTFTLREEAAWAISEVSADSDRMPTTINAQVVESDATRANMLQAGEIDLATVTGTERDRLNSDEFTATLELPSRPGQLFFNQAEGRVGNDLVVRTAIAQGLDRAEIGAVSGDGRGEPLVSLVASTGAACTAMDSSDAIPAFDTAAAEQALDEAGWELGEDGVRAKDGQRLSVILLYPVNESTSVTAAIELMQSQLQVIGIEGVPTPASSYTDVIFSGGDWDLVWAPINTSLPSDWLGILSGEFPPDGGNWTYNTNQEYLDLANEANTMVGEEGCAGWEAAQDSLFSHLEILPIASSTETIYGSGVDFGVSRGVLMPMTFEIPEQ